MTGVRHRNPWAGSRMGQTIKGMVRTSISGCESTIIGAFLAERSSSEGDVTTVMES